MDAAANLPPPLPRELAEPTRLPLGSLLLRDALLTAEQLEQALTEKDSTGRRLGEIVVGHGWVPAATVAGLLAEQHGLEYVDLAKTDIEPAAAGLLPEKYARRYEALPLRFVADDAVLVAVADPTNVVASDDLRLALGLNVRVVVAAGPDLATAIERTYRASLDVEAVEDELDEEGTALEDIRGGAATSAPAITFVNSLIARAIDEKASDLHFEPQAKQMVVRARIDGVMRRLTTISKALQPAVTSRLKIMGELDILNDDDRVLITIEDPVEYQTPGLNQVEVNFKSGLTFARGLRTILRSDPDVLLVGEIRDEETARIAIQAAMTGHLVLTTLHTHNAASSIARLVDMGVEPSLLATSINCIVAQRLARRLCTHCREPYWPEEHELAELGLERPSDDTWLYRPVGCVHCSGTGFTGRVALYEVMTVQGRLRRLLESGSTDEIFAEAVAQGMMTLRQDGIRLALEGVSSLDEVRRVTGDRLV